MENKIMQHFAYDHLPEKLQDVSKPICRLAKEMNFDLPDGPEKSAGLRKLLEAKDCFVRASLEAKSDNPPYSNQGAVDTGQGA